MISLVAASMKMSHMMTVEKDIMPLQARMSKYILGTPLSKKQKGFVPNARVFPPVGTTKGDVFVKLIPIIFWSSAIFAQYPATMRLQISPDEQVR